MEAKKIRQYTKNNIYIRTYDSISKASIDTGIDHSNISNCAIGRLKSAGYYVWKYTD